MHCKEHQKRGDSSKVKSNETADLAHWEVVLERVEPLEVLIVLPELRLPDHLELPREY